MEPNKKRKIGNAMQDAMQVETNIFQSYNSQQLINPYNNTVKSMNNPLNNQFNQPLNNLFQKNINKNINKDIKKKKNNKEIIERLDKMERQIYDLSITLNNFKNNIENIINHNQIKQNEYYSSYIS